MSQIPIRCSSLVSTEWVANIALTKTMPNPKPVRVLDASWHLSRTKRTGREEYKVKHIPTSQFFDLEECCDKSSPYKVMLPRTDLFQSYVGNLGICNNTHVILYDNSDVFSSARMWWMFRAFGHNLVSVMDGGLHKWESEGRGLTDEVDSVQPRAFEAIYKPELVKSFEEIQRNITERKFTLMDARSAVVFEGKGGIIEGKPTGHIPNSVNIPYPSLFDQQGKAMKSPEVLQQLFRDQGINLDARLPLAATCGGGISACILAFAARLCGRDDVAVYDGSWSEWHQRATPEHMITST